MRLSISTGLAAATIAIFMTAGGPAFAEKIAFKADLAGSAQVPPNDSKGHGTVDATYDTDSKTLSWTITYDGLTGPATAAHFHGPAAVGANAKPVVPIEGTLTSPINGTSTLTDQQATDLENGLWYFNVHTAKFPDGEIRGQVTK